jgi:hypothetical protein
MIAFDRTPLPEAIDVELDQLLWRGREWGVTSYGLEKLDGTYAASKFGVTNWRAHIKACGDTPELRTALVIALALHRRGTIEDLMDIVEDRPPATKRKGRGRPRK